mmetsp:Transcript_56336/g.119900  ORF Transcript_56336/g.119900 Transcript_56336/m.119900 type:complete len:411 (+) Transcript_56336:30-1262(+)
MSYLVPKKIRTEPGAGTWSIDIRNAISGRVLTTCYVLPTDLIVTLKQCIKTVQVVPAITLMTEESEFLNPVETIQEAGLKDGDVVLAVMIPQRLVATAAGDGFLRTWDVESGAQERAVPLAPTRSLLSACCTPDGFCLVTGSASGTPKFWDMKQGFTQKAFEGGHSSSISSVDVSSNGKRIVTGGYDFLVKVWDCESGKCLQTFIDPELAEEGLPPRAHLLHLLCVRFSPYDPNLVASASADCTAKLWDVKDGRCLHTVSKSIPAPKPADPPKLSAMTALCFAANGTQLVTASENMATLWNVKTGKELRTWEAHTSLVTSLALAVEDSVLLTGSKDGTAKVWDLPSGLCRRTLQGHDGPVMAVALSPDSKSAVTGGSDGQAKVWDTQTGTCERTLEGSKLGLVMANFVSC